MKSHVILWESNSGVQTALRSQTQTDRNIYPSETSLQMTSAVRTEWSKRMRSIRSYWHTCKVFVDASSFPPHISSLKAMECCLRRSSFQWRRPELLRASPSRTLSHASSAFTVSHAGVSYQLRRDARSASWQCRPRTPLLGVAGHRILCTEAVFQILRLHAQG
jgi:hypothetical protein